MQQPLQTIDGSVVADMPNYYFKTSGEFYFSGMLTAVLPMIPGLYAIYRLVKEHRKMKAIKVAGAKAC